MSTLQIPKYGVKLDRTKLVMIVNSEFTDFFPERPWAKKDAIRLRNCFPNCSEVYTCNQTAGQMEETFKNVSTDIDCLVVFVSSYGRPGIVLGADGGSQFSVALMLDLINENEALAGKPLVFILQTCDLTKAGPIAHADGGNDNGNKDTWTIPSTADTLVVQSLYPGRHSNSEYSSYIDSLCSELEDNAKKSYHNDIRHIMTRVIARMKHEIKKEHLPEAQHPMMKLMPMQVSTLTKQLFI